MPPKNNGRGVLVLHAWWGLNETMKMICDQLADAGFTAFAPDLYHGQLTEDIAEAETLSSALFGKLDQVQVALQSAISTLEAQTGQVEKGLAVIGFSLGAFFALDLSVTAPELIRTVVVYYGTRPGDYRKSKASFLGHFAELDEFEPQTSVDQLKTALREAGRSVDFYQYKNTGHWFAEPDRPQDYRAAAAKLAWDRTLTFLRNVMNE